MGIFDELKSPAPKNFFSKGKGNLISNCIITYLEISVDMHKQSYCRGNLARSKFDRQYFLDFETKSNGGKYCEINLALISQDSSTFYSTMGEIPCTICEIKIENAYLQA